MLQAALFDCLLFDLFPFSQNGFIAPEVDVSGRDVIQALVVELVVVVLYKREVVAEFRTSCYGGSQEESDDPK